jgi:tetratricopeptide (TPR) repeat protein
MNLEDVGDVRLENTGTRKAQQPFHHGLAQLHNFEYWDAAEDFQKARTIDPNFALAYWGEAMTHNHPVWQRQDRDAALKVLNAYAPTPEARQSKAQTALERDLFSAVDVLYGNGEKNDRDDLYRNAMKSLFEKYPANVEIASFYALSILGTAHEGRDYATYMQSAAILQEFIGDYPTHPGLAHYLIHSTDDPVHAPLGLGAANAYGDIAPGAGHAQHMTTHIYLALGDWDGVIRANTRAVEIVNVGRREKDLPLAGCGHYSSWLMYGYLQNGNRKEAHKIMALCAENSKESDSNRTLGPFAWQRSLYLFDTGEWDGDFAKISQTSSDAPSIGFEMAVTNGWVDLKNQNLSSARSNLLAAKTLSIQMNKEWDDEGVPSDMPYRNEPEVQLLQLSAMIALEEGSSAIAIKELQKAVALEATLPHGFGPPQPAKPSHELLGEVLISLDRMDEAKEHIKQSLQRTPNKKLSLEAKTIIEASERQ